MELIHRTLLKKMNPKKGFTAPYIRFPWNTHRALIGKPVSIYKVDGGYFLSIDSNEFKPENIKMAEKGKGAYNSDKFKPKVRKIGRAHV